MAGPRSRLPGQSRMHRPFFRRYWQHRSPPLRTFSPKVHFIMWFLAVLLALNFLLAILFCTILFVGTITDSFTHYITNHHLYAPPAAGLLVTVAAAIVKRLIGAIAPSGDAQKRLLRNFTLRLLKAIDVRIVAWLIGCVALLALASTQLWAVDKACAPAPELDPELAFPHGPYGTAGLGLSSDERFLYLADERSGITEFSASQPGRINQIEESYRQIANVPTGSSPQAIVRSRDGRYLYIANSGNGTMSIFDLRDQKLLAPVKVGNRPRWIAASPDGKRLYVSNEAGSITVVDAATQATIGEIEGVNCPEGLAVSPTGDRLYVASQCGGGTDPLFIVDTNSDKKIDEVPGLAVGNAVITSKDGKKIYVTRANFNWFDPRSGKVGAPLSIIDAETLRVIKTLILQVSASGLALTPDGRYVLVTNGYQLSVVDSQNDEVINNLSLRGYGGAIAVRTDNVVIVAVSDARRLVTFPLDRALSHWPCASL